MVQDLSIQDFLYELPEERIAQYPLADRAESKLLIYRSGSIAQHKFSELPKLLPEHTVLVRNNSRVIHARLLFRKESGAQIEIFCLSPLEPTSYELALESRSGCTWQCMLGNARRWRSEQPLVLYLNEGEHGAVCLTARRESDVAVAFSWDNTAYTFGEILELMGILPIPPYLNRDTQAEDSKTYQTVYAASSGSVAAPTAGLHFTPEVFTELELRGIEVLDLTLHVGAGTFRPVKSETIGLHRMHQELVLIDRATIERLQTAPGRIIAVGTTSVRSLESLYHLGVKLLLDPDVQVPLSVEQWQAYNESSKVPTAAEALDAVLIYMQDHGLEVLSFPTSILIAPGYEFRLVRGLITNFHQPHSTLLLLIAALVGEDWRHIYEYALTHDFRFLSYGDSSLLLP